MYADILFDIVYGFVCFTPLFLRKMYSPRIIVVQNDLPIFPSWAVVVLHGTHIMQLYLCLAPTRDHCPCHCRILLGFARPTTANDVLL